MLHAAARHGKPSCGTILLVPACLLLHCTSPLSFPLFVSLTAMDFLRAAVKTVLDGRLPPADVTKTLISKASSAHTKRHCPTQANSHADLRSAALQGLGYGILAGSVLVKVPQLLNVLRAGSAAGLSPLSCELETLGLVIAVTYGFLMGLPFSAFGETVVSCMPEDMSTGAGGCWPAPCASPCGNNTTAPAFITSPQALLVQNNLLLVLIYFYQRRSLARSMTLLALLVGSGFFALSGNLTSSTITKLYDFNNVTIIASR